MKLLTRHITLITLFLIAFTIAAKSQEKIKLPKKKVEEANYYYSFENYHLALPVLKELYAMDSTNSDINYKIALCKFNTTRNKPEAKKYFEQSKNDFIDAYYYLGLICQLQMNFDKAIELFQYYKYWYGKKSFTWDEADYHINKCLTAKTYILHPVRVTIKNLGNTINSLSSDYVPLITSDENTLFFTSRREGSIGDKKDPLGEYFEDIYISNKTDTGWSQAQNLGTPVNSETHDACVAITPDGQKLFLYRTNSELTGGNIFISERQNNQWTEPVKIDAEINTKEGLESSGTISPDESVFYFSSNRSGGYGGKDLYRVIKFPNGKWSKAQNMGPTINTPYDEDAPFIHPDGQTLYFSSKGHKNMGGYVIFKTVMNYEGEWSNPENLGYPLNSVHDDLFFVITADNMRGYYSCDKEGNGNHEIFTIDMPENNSNYKLLKGVVLSNDSIPVTIKATIIITLIDNQTNSLQGVYRTNKETGNYLFIVDPGKKYKIIIEAEGYESMIDWLEIPAIVEEQIIFKNIQLKRKKNTE